MIDPKRDNKATNRDISGLFNCPQVFILIASMLSDTHQWSSSRSINVRHFWRCRQFIRQVDTAVNDKMFGLKYGPRKMTLEKPLVGRFRLPSVRPWGKAPNRELPPKSGDITCMHQGEHLWKIILKSMHKCRSYGLDKFNLWPFYHLTFKCDLDLQPTQINVSTGTSSAQGQHLIK